MALKVPLRQIKSERLLTPTKDSLALYYNENGVLCAMDSMRNIIELSGGGGLQNIIHDNTLVGNGNSESLGIATYSYELILSKDLWYGAADYLEQSIRLNFDPNQKADVFIFAATAEDLRKIKYFNIKFQNLFSTAPHEFSNLKFDVSSLEDPPGDPLMPTSDIKLYVKCFPRPDGTLIENNFVMCQF